MEFVMQPEKRSNGELRVLLREAIVTLCVNVLSALIALTLLLVGGIFTGDLRNCNEQVRFLKWSGLGLATGVFYVGLTLVIFFAVKVVKSRKNL